MCFLKMKCNELFDQKNPRKYCKLTFGLYFCSDSAPYIIALQELIFGYKCE